jgi:hypothetical protein
MKKFVKLHVKPSDGVLPLRERYIRPARITELRLLRLGTNDPGPAYRYEVVLDTGEVTFLDWEDRDIDRSLLAIMGKDLMDE